MAEARMRNAVRLVMAFAAAVSSTAAAASLVQTQVNLAALVALGAPITLALRAATSAEDLDRFGPVMAAIAAGVFIPALNSLHSRWIT